MKRERVDSTTVRSIGYDPRRRELDVEFLESGVVYRYLEVPAEEHTAFMAADSKGTYLNTVFKPKGYRYFILTPKRW